MILNELDAEIRELRAGSKTGLSTLNLSGICLGVMFWILRF
jgi:hypothetical protein